MIFRTDFSLPARTSILAAANPVGGHYNKDCVRESQVSQLTFIFNLDSADKTEYSYDP